MAITTKIFFIVFMMMSFTLRTSAKIYKVGDSDGWTAKDIYREWNYNKVFYVGDSLVFEYDRNFNDVTQVSGALEYEFCDTSSPKAVYNTGHDVVTLTEPGSYYFITSNQTQCLSGQKFDVLVVYNTSSPIPSPPTPTSTMGGQTFKVGESKGWSIDVESDYYNKWSVDKEFNVGDVLLFEYGRRNKLIHEVLEINGDLEFLSCDPTSPVAVYKTGHDLVSLTKPGVHYFISSETAYCYAGLKLRVVVAPQPGESVRTFHEDFPKKIEPSAMNRLMKWLRSFRPHH